MREFSAEKRKVYLDVLREGKTPFGSFVSRKNTEDVVDIANPRKEIDRFIFQAIRQIQQDHSTRLLPLLGPAGSGKTHAYWAYKGLERQIAQGKTPTHQDHTIEIPQNWTIIYVPSPNPANRVLLHIFTCLLDELSPNIVENVALNAVNRWMGELGKKKGLLGLKESDLEDIINAGMREFPGIYIDAVKCLCWLALDKSKKELAKRWLLGEVLTPNEMKTLKVQRNVDSEEMCFAMIKMICEFAGKVIILYFDEMEILYRSSGIEAEKKVLEAVRQINLEIKNLLIILAVLTELWKPIFDAFDRSFISRTENPHELKPFILDDVYSYFGQAMKWFWAMNEVEPLDDELFPLNKEILRVIFQKTNGNARNIIKLIQMYVDKILNDEDLDDI